MIRTVAFAFLLMSVASVASARPHHNCDWCGPSVPFFHAPEIDPASAVAGLTLLAGGLAVLRGRHRKTQD